MSLKEKFFFEEKYPILAGWLKKHKGLYVGFKLLYYGLPILMVLIYVVYVIHRFRAYGKRTLLRTVAVPGAAFAFVSVFRKYYNKERPYERFEYEPLIDRKKGGKSMPSRHAFSAGIISATIAADYPIVAPFLWILTGLIALTRLLAGVHHFKDVIAGIVLAVVTHLALMLPVSKK